MTSIWVTGTLVDGHLVDAALQWLATVTRDSPETVAQQVRRMTRYDFDRMWQAVPADTLSPTASLVRAVLRSFLTGNPIGTAEILRSLASTTPDGANDCGTVVQAVCGLLDEQHWPALIVTSPTTERDQAVWFRGLVRTLEQVATAVPRLPLAVAVDWVIDPKQPAERALSWAREGVISIRGITADELVNRLRHANVQPLPPPEAVQRLAVAGLSGEAAAAYVGAAAAVRRCQDAAGETDARSAAERFLFEQLESLPQTAGLFRLNRPLEFDHGPRPAEADLVVENLKVVVEVDGGRYHLNTQQYRRDRRKDWLYQQHGFLVLRFLAEDVVEDLPAILNTILEAVALRQTSSSLAGEPL